MVPFFVGNTQKALEKIIDRREIRFDSEEKTVKEIISAIKKNGDKALFQYAHKLDNVKISKRNLRISKDEISRAADKCSPALKKAICRAVANIKRYHSRQSSGDFVFSPARGIKLSQRTLPVPSVGLYIPGGIAPLFSTLLMTAVPAMVAKVPRIAVATPCKNGLDPAIAFSLMHLKLFEVYRMGGAQAIAAFAYGTESVTKVDKVAGPGNVYVSLAKKILYGLIDIDMIAGPSEVLVIADNSANPAVVARDFLSQSEHGTGKESSILLTTSRELARKVYREIEMLLAGQKCSSGMIRAIKEYGLILVLKSLEECAETANLVAPEHLELAVAKPQKLVPLIRNCGALFVGHNTCESVGDYYAGPSHVLPTNGTARFFSPLSVYHFLKRMSVVEYDSKALKKAAPDIIAMAEAEGLHYHAEAVRIRV